MNQVVNTGVITLLDGTPEIDQRAEELRQSVGDLTGFHPLGNEVLVAIYVRPEKTKGGIILTEKTREEDEYQGKVGLILKVGEKAFDREWQKMYGDTYVPKVGDWVTFKVYESWQQRVNGTPCRQMKDSTIRAVVNNPEMVY